MSLSKRPLSGYGSGTTDAYKSNEISTVSQGRLIIMLYEGAIRFLNIANDNISDPKKYDLVNTNIIKTQEIINELMTSLNVDEGGKVANDLLALYVYFKKRLLEANMNKDKRILLEIIKFLSDLKSAWEDIEKKETTPQVNMPRSSGFSIKG